MIEGLTLNDQEYELEGLDVDASLSRLKISLEDIDGVEKLVLAEGKITISYYPDLLSLATIRHQIESLGFKIKIKKDKRNPFNRFVDRLIESNKKSFGSETLDCCNLNKKPRLK